MRPRSGTVTRCHALPSQCSMSESRNPTSAQLLPAATVLANADAWIRDRTAEVPAASVIVNPPAHTSSRPGATTLSSVASPVTGTWYSCQAGGSAAAAAAAADAAAAAEAAEADVPAISPADTTEHISKLLTLRMQDPLSSLSNAAVPRTSALSADPDRRPARTGGKRSTMSRPHPSVP